MNNIQKLLNNTLKEHDRRNKYIAVLTALSLFVSFVVSSILIMPADSKAGSLKCSLTEHTHTENCKQLICKLEENVAKITTTSEETVASEETTSAQIVEEASENIEEVSEAEEGTVAEVETTEVEKVAEVEETTEQAVIVHSHTEECYIYVCGLEEHVHSEECYEAIEVGSELSPEQHQQNINNNAAFNAFNIFGRPLHMDDPMLLDIASNSTEDADSILQSKPGAILGVANNFHILAEEVAFRSHVHGNIATNLITECGAFGVYNNRLAGKTSINYIREIGENADLSNAYGTQLIVGSNYTVTEGANNYFIKNTETGKESNVAFEKFGGDYAPRVIIEEPNKPYINISKELDYFAKLSKTIADKSTTDSRVTITSKGEEGYELDFSNVTDKYIYYTFDVKNQISQSSYFKVLEIKGLKNDQFLFFTVDVGEHKSVSFGKAWRVYDEEGNAFATGEVPLDAPNCRVIYNIVNSKDGVYTPFGEENGKGTDAQIVLGETKTGTFLVPRGYVNGAGNTNGTIIAYKFVATGETHRNDIQFEDAELDDADWQNPVFDDVNNGGSGNTSENTSINITVNKVWNDGIENGNHSNDSVTVQLYKAYEAKVEVAQENINNRKLQSTGRQITLNSGNDWNAVFDNLPVRENNQLVYYYIKENDFNGYTAEYSANGLNSIDRTVTVRNSKKIDITVEQQWYKNDGSVSDNKPQITFEIYKSTVKLDNNVPVGAEKIGEYTLSGSNTSYTVKDLKSEEDGKTVYYYVVEKSGSDNYNVSYENNAYSIDSTGNIIIKNTEKKAETISLSVTKGWVADDYQGVQDYVSPVKQYNIPVTVKLLRSTDNSNWVTVGDPVTFTTSYTFVDLPKQENGMDYYYRVVEQSVYGYSASYNPGSIYASSFGSGQTGYIEITNTLITKSLSISKNWYNNQKDGVNSVVIEVYRKLAGYNPDIAGDETEFDNPDSTTPDNGNDNNGTPDNSTPDNGDDNNETPGGSTEGGEQVSGNTVTIVPENGEFDDEELWGGVAWVYTIPQEYYGKKIDGVKVKFSKEISASSVNCAYMTSSTGWSGVSNNLSGNIYNIDFRYVQSADNITKIAVIKQGEDFKVVELEITFSSTIVSGVGNTVQSFIRNPLMLFDSVSSGSSTDVTLKKYSSEEMQNTYAESLGFAKTVHLVNYTGKYLDKIEVYYRNEMTNVPDANADTNLFIHDNSASYGMVSKTQNNGNDLVYINGRVVTHEYDNVSIDNGVRDDFFRIKTIRPEEIEKIVLVFSDQTTFTMNNKSYVSNTNNVGSGSIDITINNDASQMSNESYSQTFISKSGNFSAYTGKTLTKIEVHYGSNVSAFPDYQTQTNLFILGAGNAGSYSGNVVTYTVNNGGVAISSLEDAVFGMRTTENTIIQKIVLVFSDQTTFTMNNKNYNSSNGNNNNGGSNSDGGKLYYDSKGITLKSSSDYQSGLLTISNLNTNISNYLDKTLSEIKVFVGSEDVLSSNWSEKFDVYLNKSDGSKITVSSPETSGKIAKYNLNLNTSIRNSGLSEDFLRIRTTANTEIVKIILGFTDGSTFTLSNNSYQFKLTNEGKTLILPGTFFIEEGQTQHSMSEYAWVYYMKKYAGRRVRSIKVTFGELIQGSTYRGITLLHDGSGDRLGCGEYSTQEYTVNCDIKITDNDQYKLVISRKINDQNDIYHSSNSIYELESVEITFENSVADIVPDNFGATENPEPENPKPPTESGVVHKDAYVTLTKYAISDQTWQYDGTYMHGDDQSIASNFEDVRTYYTGKVLGYIEVHYRNALSGFPDYMTDFKQYAQYINPYNTSEWLSFKQYDYRIQDNVATWYYEEISGIYADNIPNNFLKVKTSRSDEISKIVICFKDGSTYTLNNTAYIPSVSVEGDYTYNNGEYVLITTITLSDANGWTYTLWNLPATDGQGNAYTYHIKEVSMSGSKADQYKLVGYSDPDGIVLLESDNKTSVTNARKDENGLVVLPSTGGIGTKGYYIAGIVMMICSVTGYQVIRRRRVYRR